MIAKAKFRSKIALFTILFGLIVLCCGNAVGAVIYIPDNYATIQQGINAASTGDTIVVRDGTYLLTEAIDFKGKALTLRSENGANKCILDGQQKTRIAFFHTGETSSAVLNGFTIQNGRADRGAGIYCEQSAPVITGCVIQRNKATSAASPSQGGGIYCKSAPATISYCTISNNQASEGSPNETAGGGIYSNASSISIVNCNIIGNAVFGVYGYWGYGGGIYLEGASPKISGSTISGNKTAPDTSWQRGGGIYCKSSSPSLTNCTIVNNSTEASHDGGNWGGGLYLSSSFLGAVGCIISGNASYRGAGLYLENSSANLTNCTVARNVAAITGGGLHNFNSSSQIVNSILWENSPSELIQGGTGKFTVTYSDVSGGYEGRGNINTNPVFVDAAGQDYHLKSNSPCIDAGDDTAPYLPTEDMDGKSRIWNGIVDMGVYEYQSCSLPGKASLISPSGSIGTTTPTYTWNAVSTATWYLLSVNDATATKINQWYTSAQAGCTSGTGTCSVTPATALDPGAGYFKIQTYNACGYGPWSEVLGFSVSVGGVPGKATLISPTGTISTTTPTFVWNAVSSATWYQLWVNDSSGSPKIKAWYTAAQAGCAAGTGTCSVPSTTPLASGSGQWWIQTWNNSGYGLWSDASQFTVVTGGVPGKATLVFPTGTITTTAPTFVWNAVSTATWYYLWVSDSTGVPRIQIWFTAGQAGCASGSGLCSVAPGIGLNLGSGQWWIQTWNSNGYGAWSDPLQFIIIASNSQ